MDLYYFKQKKDYDVMPDNNLCTQTVGALLHLAPTTRPDVAAAVGIVCRRVSKPKKKGLKCSEKDNAVSETD